ncbi:tetratricopeptide repeat protein [Haloechinothrix sp. YIM 98757]|uniref:Tetratricopeptide repeat protein n=1 Tax=Haloechinothrix aidingensis TaxID=2752311 RepID=A0A838A9L5_9PSEU|nr:tetratricopeptide repeat protein [Haloechinothrix aidingensis]MBA0125451.1 tetratricopeptide repeat protein [Haloechinothrix aidingensis]
MVQHDGPGDAHGKQPPEACVTGDGQSHAAAFRRAESLLEQRRPQEALAELAPVLAAEPDKPSVQLVAGLAYFRSAQLHKAEQAFARLVEHDPSDDYARFALGKTMQRLGKLAEALGHLKLASAMNPLPHYQETLGEVSARLAVLRD